MREEEPRRAAPRQPSGPWLDRACSRAQCQWGGGTGSCVLPPCGRRDRRPMACCCRWQTNGAGPGPLLALRGARWFAVARTELGVGGARVAGLAGALPHGALACTFASVPIVTACLWDWRKEDPVSRLRGNVHWLARQRAHSRLHGGPGLPGPPWVMGTGELGEAAWRSPAWRAWCAPAFLPRLLQNRCGQQPGRRVGRLRPSDRRRRSPRPSRAPSVPWKWTCRHKGTTPFRGQRPQVDLCVASAASCPVPVPAAAPAPAAHRLVLLRGPLVTG